MKSAWLQEEEGVAAWLLRCLFLFLARWPLAWLHRLGSALGSVIWFFSHKLRARVLQHLRGAHFSAATGASCAQESGKLVLELPRLWSVGSRLQQVSDRDAPANVPIEWHGAEQVESALAVGRGLLVLTPHLGCFEAVAQGYAARFGAQHPMTAMFRPPRFAPARAIVAQARNRQGLHTAPTNQAGVKQLLLALRSGACAGFLPDQVPPQGQGVFAPFFGRAAYTVILPLKLIWQTGAAGLWIWGERLGQGRGFRLHVFRIGFHAGDWFAGQAQRAQPNWGRAATAMNREIEALITQCPEQYLWSYNRYKEPSTPQVV